MQDSNMRSFVLLLCLIPYLSIAQPSYWFQQFQRKQDAQLAQEFFFVPGTGMTFTYQTNRVILNAAGTNVFVGQTNFPYGAITNAPWQWGCPNLTNWCLFPTNVLSSITTSTNFPYTAITNAPWQWGCDNLTNWCLIDTNTLEGFSTNISYTQVTNAPWQWGCANLTNWCLFPTNVLSGFSQTPWITNINGAGFYESNAINLFASNIIGGNILFASNTAYLREVRSSTDISPFFKLVNNGKFNFAASLNNAGQLGALQLDFPNGGSDTALFMGGNITAQPFGKTLLQQGGQYLWSTSLQGISPNPAITIHGTPTFVGTRPYSIYIGTTVVGSGDTELVVDQVGQTNLFMHSVLARQGVFTTPTNNGIAGALYKSSPLMAWASIMSWGTNTIVTNAATYHILTNNPNFSTTRTNYFRVNTAAGLITNVFDGFYRCTINMSGVTLDNNAMVEGDLLLNGVERDEISFITVFDNPPRIKGMTATGILYIPAGTQITFQIKSSGASGFTVYRAQVVIGTP